jgi:hypothetical protein
MAGLKARFPDDGARAFLLRSSREKKSRRKIGGLKKDSIFEALINHPPFPLL